VRPPSKTASATRGTARAAILEAAVQEFVEHGYDGIRLEHVAKRAGRNKALVYRYFGDRENLFQEALRAQFAKRSALLDKLPADFGDMLAWWTAATRKDRTFIRMILRESLDHAGNEPVESAARTAYYERQKAMLDTLREEGVVDKALDGEMLFLALLAVVTLPSVMPQVVRLVTGRPADARAFTQRWEKFLHRFAKALAPRSRKRR
jgi:AcrR family transcriptional regulator